jgi:hypothetical protein
MIAYFANWGTQIHMADTFNRWVSTIHYNHSTMVVVDSTYPAVEGIRHVNLSTPVGEVGNHDTTYL